MPIKKKRAVKKKAKKVEECLQTFRVVNKIKADIADHVIIANVGDTVKLTPNEADVLIGYIEE